MRVGAFHLLPHGLAIHLGVPDLVEAEEVWRDAAVVGGDMQALGDAAEH